MRGYEDFDLNLTTKTAATCKILIDALPTAFDPFIEAMTPNQNCDPTL